MDSLIYFDNNATTKVDEEVFNAMLPYLKEEYGNPSSIYSIGRKTKEEITKARENIAKLLNSKPENIIFTSCGSESNITAINSSIKLNPNKKHIITTKVEHASIMEMMNQLEKDGYIISYLNVDNRGCLDLNELKKSIRPDTCLISIMMANNEIGNIYPIKEIAKIAHDNDIIIHCDAVQALGKIKIDVEDLDVDYLSVSGHKINAPKGIGVLYIKNSDSFTPLIFGHQEKNRRGGTENVPYIIGLGKAAEIILKDNYQKEKEIESLRDYLEEEVEKNIEDIHIYGDKQNRTPNTSSIAFKGVKADELMLVLESFNIYVSTGSACNSSELKTSHVLSGMGIKKLYANCAFRISIDENVNEEELNDFLDNRFKPAIKFLGRMRTRHGEE